MGRESSNDLPCNTAHTRRAASLHCGSLGRCDSQPLSQKQIKEKRRKWRSNISVDSCYNIARACGLEMDETSK